MNQKALEKMVADRRAIHKHPELAWEEFETTYLIARRLRELGFQVLLGPRILDKESIQDRDPAKVEKAMERARRNGVPEEFLQETEGLTGVVGVWDTHKEGPVLAFRSDIDALPIVESEDPEHEAVKGGFASEFHGLMHACGHDAHAAVGLAVAEWVARHNDELQGKIKIIFQPAEEGVRGGFPLAQSGVIDDVDEILCFHVGAGAKLGEVVICEQGFLATTKIDIEYEGIPSHAGTAPEKGRSALLAACNAATLLSGIPRHSDGVTRISVGKLSAGESRNTTPVHALLQIETRGATEALNAYMVESAYRIAKGSAASFDVKVEIRRAGSATTLQTDKELSDYLISTAKSIGKGVNNVRIQNGVTASEDCTWLVKRVQDHGGKAGYFLFGSKNNGQHRGDFSCQDTETLPVAFEILTRFLKDRSKNR